MEIARPTYLQQLIDLSWDGQVKVITGIRRCGKSYLLNRIYRQYLLNSGVAENRLIFISLDFAKDIRFRNPLILAEFVHSLVDNTPDRHYLFIDEIQMSDEVPNPYNHLGKKITFYDAINDLRSLSNLDIYVTGSNSKMLSSDILTEFRGRSDEIRVHPLSFAEFYAAVQGDKREAFEQYAIYGGLPFTLAKPNDSAKIKYLDSLFSEVYLKDIIERKHVERPDILAQIIDFICSSIGSLTNPHKIAGFLQASLHTKIAPNTVSQYIQHLQDAFLISESKRYDVKGKKYFAYPYKYYCEDLGLRNARLGFRQQEMTHIMENIIYNELIIRNFNVDVGVVYEREINDSGFSVRQPREIDFIATQGTRKIYIQSAYALPNPNKIAQETAPLAFTGDSFPKVIIRQDMHRRWYDEKGNLNLGLLEFLLDKDSL